MPRLMTRPSPQIVPSGFVRAHTGAAVAIACLLVASSVWGQATTDPWGPLRHRTAWILLGDVWMEDQSWSTQIKHMVVGSRRRGQPDVPTRGDRLRLTESTPLVIVGFRSDGERQRRRSPANRALNQGDLTGLELPADALVTIVEVTRGRPISDMRERRGSADSARE